MDRIKGFWVAMTTPVGTDGRVDTAAFVRHARGLLGQGIDGLVPFGTTGEGTSFTASERLAAVEALLAAGIAPERLALGCGCPAAGDSAALGRAALGLGLTHLLVLPPYFYRDAPPAGIEDAFAAVIDGIADARARVTLYHIPQVSGVAVPPEVAARLRERYGKVVAGVKDSSGDFAQFRAFRAAAPDLGILVGSEADIARALAEGGTGTICGLANVAPALVRAMFENAEAEGPMRAFVAQFAGRPFVPTLKAVQAAVTGDPVWLAVRAPLRAGDAALGEAIAATLRPAGAAAA